MKLTMRFIVLIAALLAAVAASATTGLMALHRLDTALTGIVENDMERLLAITHTRRLFRSMVVLERDYILAKTAAERAKMDTKMESLAVELQQQLHKYAGLMPSQDTPTVARIGEAATRWHALDERVRAAAQRDQDEASALSKQHSLDPVPWEKSIGDLVKLSESRLAEQAAHNHVVYRTAESRLIAVSSVAALLAAVFGYAILLSIRRNLAEVVRLNTNLEGQVKARTETLVQREQSLRLVLDSIGDGLFEVGLDGRLSGACSAAAVRQFGVPQPGSPLPQYLFPDDADQAAQFAVAFDQLAEDILPWDLCRDQMPRRLLRGTQVLELEWKRVIESGHFTKILVVTRDVTEAVEAERAEKSAREQQSLIGKLLQDKAGFAQFVKECENLISSLSSSRDVSLAKRDLHTLKGNVSIFGLTTLAEFCHAVEDRMAASDGLPSSSDVADLAALWRTRLQSIETFLSELGASRLEVELSDHTRLLESLLKRQDYEEIIGMVELWSWQRTAERLTRLRAYAEHLAERLGKSVEINIEHNDVRVPRDYLQQFWTSLVHVIRNAVDHGAEATEERLAHGKAAHTTLTFVTSQTPQGLIVEVRDDGPGVDRAALARSAAAVTRDLPADSKLEDLLFMEGVSTRQQVSETSGRGVGLAAVKHACEAEGGSVEVMTVAGRGTTFRFRFRQPVVKPGALAARLERRWSLRPTTSVPAPAANTNALGPAQRSGSDG